MNKLNRTRGLLNDLLRGTPVSEKDKEAAKKEMEDMERDLKLAHIGSIVYRCIALALALALILTL